MAERSNTENSIKRLRMRDIANWRPHPTVVKIWRIFRPLLVLAISLGVAYSVFSYGFQIVLDRYINPVDIQDATPITVVVEKSDSASKIATKLYRACGEEEPGVISNTAVFKIYVDFVGKANRLQAGTYILSRNMDIPQIVDILCAGNPPKSTIKFTALEGYSINGVLGSLQNAGLEVDQAPFEAEFLKQCNDRQSYEKYDFIKSIPDDAANVRRDYLLEGYLFPDTYTVYADASPNDIITKMLVRFNEIFTDEYIARAAALGMTIDEVVTLASIIQREAALEDDFAKVSAVFHNRINSGMKLESCATLQYVLKVNKYVYNEQERATDSPFNTYLYTGLPMGPICNPGKQAIEAALYPNEDYLGEDGYKYFCNMDLPDNKALAFARTYDQHKKNIQTYEKYWN